MSAVMLDEEEATAILMGRSEVAQELRVQVPNLGKVVGLPEPIAQLRCGAIWDAAEIREFARLRRARIAARHTG